MTPSAKVRGPSQVPFSLSVCLLPRGSLYLCSVLYRLLTVQYTLLHVSECRRHCIAIYADHCKKTGMNQNINICFNYNNSFFRSKITWWISKKAGFCVSMRLLECTETYYYIFELVGPIVYVIGLWKQLAELYTLHI